MILFMLGNHKKITFANCFKNNRNNTKTKLKFMFKPISINPVVWIALLALAIASCSPYQKLLKSDDVYLKREKALAYYEKGDYNKALTLITDIIPAFRGTADAETLNYYYAMVHFKMKDYVMAAHYFKTFSQGFPRSQHVEEFLFLSAYCKYLLSPRPSLDQKDTRDAIAEFQFFINRFPNSSRVEEANSFIDELRLKLETKAFNTAMMYFNLGDYIASTRTFNNVIRDYPDTKFREEAMFYILRSNFHFAENSIHFRQLERYRDVVQAHNRLINRFPETRFLGQANRMLSTAQEMIARLETVAQTP